MCKASRAVNKTVDAKAGSTLAISTVQDHAANPGTHGAFHAPGQTTAQCVHCVQTGQKLTLSNISATLRDKFGLHSVEVATFVEVPLWHKDDGLIFDRTNVAVDLKTFADQGVAVYVGEHAHDTEKGVASLREIAAQTEDSAIAVEQTVGAGTSSGRRLARHLVSTTAMIALFALALV